MVIGDRTTELALTRAGIVRSSDTILNFGNRGVAFLRTDGQIAFIRDNLGFNGDDALEIQIAWQRADVFGRIGEDPGEAWGDATLSTRASNLTLLRLAAFGSEGFDHPRERFRQVHESEPLEGFGTAPVMDLTYATWVQQQGVPPTSRGFAADPDRDGLGNLIEFAFVLDPVRVSSLPWQFDSTLDGAVRTDAPSLRTQIQTSADLQAWTPLVGEPQAFQRLAIKLD